ncbi:hypothetical protein Rt10032_c12g4935 [Rhodotorula toruloides]|uniref:Uncharacterized protein n=1 Tax=Rhodotorula toruloides TaxID=5286 RepID=A0A511KKL5_RHOTO|nr:hypothetical protein Rt10032_c12g4935 [Rhodotorula toruloides]
MLGGRRRWAGVTSGEAAFGGETLKAVEAAGVEKRVAAEAEQQTTSSVAVTLQVARSILDSDHHASRAPPLSLPSATKSPTSRSSATSLSATNPQVGEWTVKDGLEHKRSIKDGGENVWTGTIKLDPSLAGKVEYIRD